MRDCCSTAGFARVKTEDAYKTLKRLKRDDESFDELLLRLIKDQGGIDDLAGSGTLTLDEQKEMKGLKENR
ncbi:MAG: hypothetical protein KGY80_04455 [Candidatus Thorarchaeota archaeon]|nr:hypothetical protein [Candidatus Thorarchaeota archaeon]